MRKSRKHRAASLAQPVKTVHLPDAIPPLRQPLLDDREPMPHRWRDNWQPVPEEPEHPLAKLSREEETARMTKRIDDFLRGVQPEPETPSVRAEHAMQAEPEPIIWQGSINELAVEIGEPTGKATEFWPREVSKYRMPNGSIPKWRSVQAAYYKQHPKS